MKESPSLDPIHRVKSWYGLQAEISVENGLWHLVRIGGIPLNHPPLVNLVLRRGLPLEARLPLSFLHEFGHLQTLPVALAHAFFLLRLGGWRRLGTVKFFKKLAAAAIAHEAVWELASETYVIVATGKAYRQIYQKHPNRRGQAIFWVGMTALATGLTAGILRRDKWFKNSGTRDLLHTTK